MNSDNWYVNKGRWDSVRFKPKKDVTIFGVLIPEPNDCQ